jgi:hypothetical protein
MPSLNSRRPSPIIEGGPAGVRAPLFKRRGWSVFAFHLRVLSVHLHDGREGAIDTAPISWRICKDAGLQPGLLLQSGER